MTQIAYGKVENGLVVDQRLFEVGQTPEGETWLPIEVETPAYDRRTHTEVRREDRVEEKRILRVRVIEPIPVTPETIKAECERRIIAHTGGGDIIGSLKRQINSNGAYQAEIDRLRARSNTIEAMSTIPLDFRDDKYWT